MTVTNSVTEDHAEAVAFFDDLNAGPKVPWSERRKLISKFFPSVDRLDWAEVFRQDPALMGRIINDILKLDAAEPGKPGKRPGLEQGDAEARLGTLFDTNYSELPFHQALKYVVGERSIRHVASKTGLNRNTVHRLLSGDQVPDEYEIEAIAKAFKIEPAYFAEYRLAYIIGFLFTRLENNPDATVLFYKRLRDTHKAHRRDR